MRPTVSPDAPAWRPLPASVPPEQRLAAIYSVDNLVPRARPVPAAPPLERPGRRASRETAWGWLRPARVARHAVL